MARPITFRNVAAPDFRGVSDLMGDARESVTSGADALTNVIKNRQTRLDAERTREREALATGFRNRLSSFNSAGDLEAALPGLREELGTMDPEVQAMVRGEARESLLGLRTRATEDAAFADEQRQRADQPGMADLTTEVNSLTATGDFDQLGARAEEVRTMGRGMLEREELSPEAFANFQTTLASTVDAQQANLTGDQSAKELRDATRRRGIGDDLLTAALSQREGVPLMAQTSIEDGRENLKRAARDAGLRPEEVTALGTQYETAAGQARLPTAGDLSLAKQVRDQTYAQYGAQNSPFRVPEGQDTFAAMSDMVTRHAENTDTGAIFDESTERKEQIVGQLMKAGTQGITIPLKNGGSTRIPRIPVPILKMALETIDDNSWWADLDTNLESALVNLFADNKGLREEYRKWQEATVASQQLLENIPEGSSSRQVRQLLNDFEGVNPEFEPEGAPPALPPDEEIGSPSIFPSRNSPDGAGQRTPSRGRLESLFPRPRN